MKIWNLISPGINEGAHISAEEMKTAILHSRKFVKSVIDRIDIMVSSIRLWQIA